MPRATFNVVRVSQLLRFATASSQVSGFYNRNKILIALLKQWYHCHKLRKTFSKFYRRHSGSMFKYNVGFKTLLQEGLFEPKFYGELK